MRRGPGLERVVAGRRTERFELSGRGDAAREAMACDALAAADGELDERGGGVGEGVQNGIVGERGRQVQGGETRR